MVIQPDPFAIGTFFSQIFHASPVAIAITTPADNRYVDVNDAYADLVGCKREELIGRVNVELSLPDKAAPADDPAARVGPLLVEYPLSLFTVGGETRDVIVSTQREEWDGRTYLITLVQDLTAYHRTQKALRATEARFRLFFDNIPLPVFVFDFETWRILDVNNATLRLYGYTRQELLSMTMLDIRPPETVGAYQATIRSLPPETRFVGVWKHRKKDGALIDVELTSYPFELDGRAVRLHVLRDVTEKLAMQAALRHSEERLHIVTDVTTDLIWELDVQTGAVQTVGLSKLLGHDDDPPLAEEWWLAHIHPGDRAAALAGFQEVLTGRKTVWNSIYRFLHADGHYVHVHNRAHVLRDENGVARRVIGATVDVSRQVAIQEAATQAKLDERRRLARDLHDAVTQSLYSLSLMVEVARRRVLAGDAPGAHESVARLGEMALQSLKEMRLLVYELRPLALDELGLVGALQNRLDAVERRSAVKANLTDALDDPLPPDVEVQLYMIAQEALNNALKHSAAAAVQVSISARDGQAALQISDDGRGFEPEATPPSAGLGLVSMRERAEKLGGHFILDTAPGQGATIRVTLSYGEKQ